MAAAISSILDRECVSGSTGICAAFRGVGNIGGQIVDMLRDSDSSNGEFQITDGEGMSDLLLYNYNNAAFSNVSFFFRLDCVCCLQCFCGVVCAECFCWSSLWNVSVRVVCGMFLLE